MKNMEKRKNMGVGITPSDELLFKHLQKQVSDFYGVTYPYQLFSYMLHFALSNTGPFMKFVGKRRAVPIKSGPEAGQEG